MIALDKRCISPMSFPRLSGAQRVNKLHGFRRMLWKKDSFCKLQGEIQRTYHTYHCRGRSSVRRLWRTDILPFSRAFSFYQVV